MSPNISIFEAYQLHFKLGSDPSLLFHCNHVTNVAFEIITQLSSDLHLNKDLILVGALLHDIGRNRNQGIKHAFESSKIIKESFLPSDFVNQVATLTSRHIGAGIPKNEAIALGLPAMDFLPLTLEEKIVAYADKMVDYKFDKSKGSYQILEWFTFNSVENEARKLSKHLGSNHPAIKRLYNLENELLFYNNNERFTLTNSSLNIMQ